ncbi:MAG: exodeoxyribonuclease V subunit alpha [Victivallales bacterium]|nr:exodeoxyribonuclease V subunit alpha [Victivallales bacterium]
MNHETADTNELFAESAIARLVRSFVLRAGMDERVAEICGRTMAGEESGGVCIPLNDDEVELLKASPLVFIADASKPESKPCDKLFVLAHNRLYTRRNWCHEQFVRERIKSMAGGKPPFENAIDIPGDGAFKNLNGLQREAIQKLGSHRFTIMTGGPGTGKTYTIARAVKLIQGQKPDLRLGLAAPTGKAATRVKEAMVKEAKVLGLDNIPDTTTLHSLLGSNYDFVTFRHDHSNPLDLDWLIVDEASMISLSMMAKLLDALPEQCGLTLVGDASQLSSVEPGRVFGDLCKMRIIAENGCKCELRDSKRFPADGEIAKLAECIKNGDAEGALDCLKAGQEFVHYCNRLKTDTEGEHADSKTSFGKIIEEHFSAFCQQDTPEGALAALNDCKILCAVRKGRFGGEKLNQLVLGKLQKRNRNCPIPMMITKNDKNLGVSNGDVGVILPAQGEKLFLPEADGIRSISLPLLPNREMAFASTIHKVQGSEFNDVIIVLPPINTYNEENPVQSMLTRELLYTALTRTKGGVYLFAEDNAVKHCCLHEIQRHTGLSDDKR